MATKDLTAPALVGLTPAKGRRVRGAGPWAHLPLGITAVLLLFPFYWTVVMATNTNADFYKLPPKLVPGTHFLENVNQVLTSINFFGSMVNTLVVAVSVTVLVLFFDSLAAFAFAKFDFPAKKFLFTLLLLFFMLPAQLSAVPQFITMINIGWVGTLQALIVPAAANAFGIFWMRQYMTNAIPDEILDAAVLDGCGFFRQYLFVVLPIIRPGLAFLGIYTFVAAWNDYVWPLIVLINPDMLTLQVALSQLNATRSTDYAVVMTGALLAIIPLVVMFLFFAKQFVADSVAGAVRG
ncbi:carbohydrate ABC transporter permease [Kineococcus gynurae]|uniref:Carbohydrate ABC transporter permease n=1 Tax=Kineococcus gynurae TaxID=452979 RepID=A0ABV5LN42_9ACTN